MISNKILLVRSTYPPRNLATLEMRSTVTGNKKLNLPFPKSRRFSHRQKTCRPIDFKHHHSQISIELSVQSLNRFHSLLPGQAREIYGVNRRGLGEHLVDMRRQHACYNLLPDSCLSHYHSQLPSCSK